MRYSDHVLAVLVLVRRTRIDGESATAGENSGRRYREWGHRMGHRRRKRGALCDRQLADATLTVADLLTTG